MRHVIDGLLSLLMAIVILVISFLPCWFTYLAFDAGAAPSWRWVFVAALCGLGLFLTLVFLRKAVHDIAPSRKKRRS